MFQFLKSCIIFYSLLFSQYDTKITYLLPIKGRPLPKILIFLPDDGRVRQSKRVVMLFGPRS